MSVKLFNKKTGQTAVCKRESWTTCRDHNTGKGWIVYTQGAELTAARQNYLGLVDSVIDENLEGTVSVEEYNSLDDDPRQYSENYNTRAAKIKVSPFSRPEGVGDFLQATQDWDDNVFLQAGHKGLVFVRGTNKSYETCFVEAFPENGGFFRGEGATVEEAELNAWNKYYSSQKCVEHEWETRGYKNGAGFCKHCNMFAIDVFDVKVVGHPCGTCGVGTNYTNLYSDDGDAWYCEQHYAEAKEELFAKLSRKHSQGEVLSVKENMMYQRLAADFVKGVQ